MRLTIFGATGGIGRHLLGQALAAGHRVTVVVRDPTRLSRQPAIRAERVLAASQAAALAPVGAGAPNGAGPVAWAAHTPEHVLPVVCVAAMDLLAPDATALEYAVGGAGAVLSALGARSPSEIGIATRSTRAIIAAMQTTGVSRIVVVSAARVATVLAPGRPQPPRHHPGDGFMRHLLGPLRAANGGHERYADLAAMEDVVLGSDLDWTLVRPSRLTDGPLTGRYRTAYGTNLRRGVSRADVAHCMLRALEQPETIKQTVGIAD